MHLYVGQCFKSILLGGLNMYIYASIQPFNFAKNILGNANTHTYIYIEREREKTYQENKIRFECILFCKYTYMYTCTFNMFI